MAYTLGGALLTIPDLPTYTVPAATTATVGGSTATLLTPTGAPSQMGILYCHPLGGTGGEVASDLVCAMLARWGFPVIGNLNGGQTAWNNPAAITNLDDSADYLVSNMNADPTAFAVYGISMGGTSSLKWASENLGVTTCWAGLAPCVSMDYFYDTQSTLSIDGAFGGAPGWAAAAATHDPQLIAEAGLLAWNGTTDTVIGSPTTVDNFIAEVPTITNFLYSNGAGGHFDIVYLDAVSIASFIAQSYAPTAAYFGLAS